MTKKMKYFSHVYVFLVVCVGFVFFRADSVSQALTMIAVMFTKFEWDTVMASATAVIFTRLFAVTLAAAVIGSFPIKEWLCLVSCLSCFRFFVYL